MAQTQRRMDKGLRYLGSGDSINNNHSRRSALEGDHINHDPDHDPDHDQHDSEGRFYKHRTNDADGRRSSMEQHTASSRSQARPEDRSTPRYTEPMNLTPNGSSVRSAPEIESQPSSFNADIRALINCMSERAWWQVQFENENIREKKLDHDLKRCAGVSDMKDYSDNLQHQIDSCDKAKNKCSFRMNTIDNKILMISRRLLDVQQAATSYSIQLDRSKEQLEARMDNLSKATEDTILKRLKEELAEAKASLESQMQNPNKELQRALEELEESKQDAANEKRRGDRFEERIKQLEQKYSTLSSKLDTSDEVPMLERRKIREDVSKLDTRLEQLGQDLSTLTSKQEDVTQLSMLEHSDTKDDVKRMATQLEQLGQELSTLASKHDDAATLSARERSKITDKVEQLEHDAKCISEREVSTFKLVNERLNRLQNDFRNLSSKQEKLAEDAVSSHSNIDGLHRLLNAELPKLTIMCSNALSKTDFLAFLKSMDDCVAKLSSDGPPQLGPPANQGFPGCWFMLFIEGMVSKLNRLEASLKLTASDAQSCIQSLQAEGRVCAEKTHSHLPGIVAMRESIKLPQGAAAVDAESTPSPLKGTDLRSPSRTSIDHITSPDADDARHRRLSDEYVKQLTGRIKKETMATVQKELSKLSLKFGKFIDEERNEREKTSFSAERAMADRAERAMSDLQSLREEVERLKRVSSSVASLGTQMGQNSREIAQCREIVSKIDGHMRLSNDRSQNHFQQLDLQMQVVNTWQSNFNTKPLYIAMVQHILATLPNSISQQMEAIDSRMTTLEECMRQGQTAPRKTAPRKKRTLQHVGGANPDA